MRSPMKPYRSGTLPASLVVGSACRSSRENGSILAGSPTWRAGTWRLPVRERVRCSAGTRQALHCSLISNSLLTTPDVHQAGRSWPVRALGYRRSLPATLQEQGDVSRVRTNWQMRSPCRFEPPSMARRLVARSSAPSSYIAGNSPSSGSPMSSRWSCGSR